MREHDLIISLTPGMNDAIQRAQRQANASKEPFGVWEHVGLYGYPGGDIPARHTFKTQAFSQSDPGNIWALVACVDPDPEPS